jgi:hypothetical protein
MAYSRRILISTLIVLVSASVAQIANKGVALVGEQRLKQLLPATVFIDGENVPTQERNAALVQLPNGKLLLASLIDTAGYSSSYQEKYSGVLLSQTAFTLGTKNFGAGAYAMGQKKNADSVVLYVYDLGGNELAQVATARQENLRPLKPLQVIAADDGSARLYLGPYYATLAGH